HRVPHSFPTRRSSDLSKEPDFKYSVVEVKKFERKPEKIIVVGAGAASYRFLASHRAINKTDEIHVFSKEKDPFYDRVLLPEYIRSEEHTSELQSRENL